jgi:hypothetical protein
MKRNEHEMAIKVLIDNFQGGVEFLNDVAEQSTSKISTNACELAVQTVVVVQTHMPAWH